MLRVCLGGEGKTGKVEEVLGWNNEGGSGSEVSMSSGNGLLYYWLIDVLYKYIHSQRSVALVTWESGNRKKYRVGHKGKVDSLGILCTNISVHFLG